MTRNLSADIQDFLDQESTLKFLEAARNFVELLEIQEIDKDEFCKKAHQALIELYSAGHRFSSVELKYSDPEKDYDKDFENKNAGKVSELGANAFYWEVFDPSYSKEENDATQGWLVDDFADIYSDLKTNLDKLDEIGTDEIVEDALWQMKFLYHHHWGNHCVDAIRALHYLWYDNKL